MANNAKGGTHPKGRIPIAPGGGTTRALKTSEMVARDIVRDINEQRLAPGDGLPSEAAMMEQYGVSRESLREGLRLLEVQGLIAIRRGPGGGPIVGTVDPANLGRTCSLYFELAGATYRELFEVWRDSESQLAERAARNRDSVERATRMKPFMEDDETHVAPAGMEEFIDAQLHFHAAVASLVRNRVLELLLQAPGQIVTHHAALTIDPRTMNTLLEHDHLVIAKAVVAGQPRRAASAMADHIEHVASQYRAHMGDDIDSYIEWR